ncbi:hypothetical protein [Anditalea andensis]|uniref:hypothetical protein n=1 Tax=Anditalea andensis TaxID=1048983 RepID=UPI00068CD2AA|nr:hypothetical protein [Anditalea andensis]
MKAKEATKVSINSYLLSIGIKPARIVRGYLFYLSPYRIENTPSFKVCNNKNLWVDYGDSKGGTLIDLVLKHNPNCGVSEAIAEIARISGEIIPYHQHLIKTSERSGDDEERRVQIHSIKELGNNLALTAYLHSRGIVLDTVKKFCKESTTA